MTRETRDFSNSYVSILGVGIQTWRLDEILEAIRTTLTAGNKIVLLGANIRAMNLAYEIPWFKEFYNRQAVFCDGFGVQIGARLLGRSIPDRYTPPDWFGDLCELCAAGGYRMFLLGTRPVIVEAVAEAYSGQFPRLEIAGTYHGFFDKRIGSEENRDVITRVNRVETDVLVVGFGMPTQEQWIMENLPNLNVKVVLAVGAMFDFLAGITPRGPRWMTDHGLEWLSRLVVEPRRLWQRYLLGNPLFFWRVLKQRLGVERYDV